MRVPTPSQTVGPFFGFALPFAGDSESGSVNDGAAMLRIQGQLLDGSREPVPDGLLEAWQGEQFARCRTDFEGVYHFTFTKPARMPGPNGSMQAPHLNLNVFARGLLRHLVTRIYFPDEAEANASDWVLSQVEPGRRGTLIALPDGENLRFDVRLQGEGETVFFEL